MPKLRSTGRRSTHRPPRLCPECGSTNLRRSRHHGLGEALRGVVRGGHPYRCRDCKHRFWTQPSGPVARRLVLWSTGVMVVLAVAAVIWLPYLSPPATKTSGDDKGAQAKAALNSHARQEIEKWLEALRLADSEAANEGPTNIATQAGSLEPAGFRIPASLLNQPLPYVEWILAKKGIAYRVYLYGPTFDRPPFQVFDLNPKPGGYVPVGGQVLIYAYQNPQFREPKWQRKVPSVAGLHLDQAEERLRKLGFQTLHIPVPTSEAAMENVVRAQSLRPGVLAWPSTQVHLKINRLAKTLQPEPRTEVNEKPVPRTAPRSWP